MNKKIFIIILTVVILALIAVVIYFAREAQQSQRELQEFEEMMAFEKEMLEQEWENFSVEFSTFPTTIHNDSLLRLLDEEKLRVQQLLEELRITRATNRTRILELERELQTVRGIMRSYIVQIDSLNRANERLERENVQVRRQVTAATQQVEALVARTRSADRNRSACFAIGCYQFCVYCAECERSLDKSFFANCHLAI
jgi:cell division protein FtsL